MALTINSSNERSSEEANSAGNLGKDNSAVTRCINYSSRTSIVSDYSAGPLTPDDSESEDSFHQATHRRGEGSARCGNERASSESSDSEYSNQRGRARLSSSDDDGNSDSSSTDSEVGEYRRRRAASMGQMGHGQNESLAGEISSTIREQARSGTEVMMLVKEKFKSLDTDGNGYIDGEEFRMLVKAILGGREVSIKESTALLKQFQIDLDGNGRVSYDEFVSFVSLERGAVERTARLLGEALLRQCDNEDEGSPGRTFARYCGNGRKAMISINEFRAMASGFGDKVGAKTMTVGEMTGLMGYVDRQGKGFVDLSDFQLFLEDALALRKNLKARNKQSKVHGGQHLDIHNISGDGSDGRCVIDLRLGKPGMRSNPNRNEREDDLLSQGYTRLIPNLNENGRGRVVHLFVKSARLDDYDGDKQAFMRARVTDVTLSRSNSNAALLSAGYQCVQPYQINYGAWFARKQYLWFRRNPDDRFPIVDVAVTAGQSKDLAGKLWTPPCRGYKRIHGDLNAGNVGSQVFLWYFKHNFQNDLEARASDPLVQLMGTVRNKLRDLTLDNDDEDGDGATDDVDLEKLWDKYDRQGKGFLSRMRFANMLTQIGLPLKHEDAVSVVEMLDTNADGRIDREEFFEFMAFNPAEVADLVKRVRTELAKRSVDTEKKIKEWFLSGGENVVVPPPCENPQRGRTRSSSRGRKSSSKSRSRSRSKGGPRCKGRSAANAKEFSRMLRGLGIKLTADELCALIGRFDRNGDGLIDAHEFTEYLLTKKASEENVISKKFVAIESACRKLRAYVRSLASSQLDYRGACEQVFGEGHEMLSKARIAEVLKEELGLKLGATELDMVLLRTGRNREKFIEFAASSTYIEAVLNVVVDAAVKANAGRFFRTLDVDGNGRLTASEFASGLKDLRLDGQTVNLSTAEVELVIQRFDRSGDGEVDIDEFLTYVAMSQRSREALLKAGNSNMLDDEERALGDPRVLYVFVALRKLFVDGGRKVEPLFDAFDASHSGFFEPKNLQPGLERLGIVPQEVQLAMGQFNQVFRRFDVQGRGRINIGTFSAFLKKAGGSASPRRGRHHYGDRVGSSPKKKTGASQDRELRRQIKRSVTPVAQELEEECHALDTKGTGAVPKGAFAEFIETYLPRRLVAIVTRRFAHEIERRAVDYEKFFHWVDGLEEAGSYSQEEDSAGDSDGYTVYHRRKGGLRRHSFSSGDEDGDEDEDEYYHCGAGGGHGGGAAFRAYVCELRGHTRSAGKLMRLLNGYAGADSRVSRQDFNDAVQTEGAAPIPRVLWESGFGSGKVQVSAVCKRVFSSAGKRGGNGRGVSSDNYSEGNDFDCEEASESREQTALALEYVTQTLRRAESEQNFSWEGAVRMFDRDGSGTVALRDLSRVLKAAGCELPLPKLRLVANYLTALRDGGSRANYENFFIRLLGDRRWADTIGGSVNPEQVEATVRQVLRAQIRSAGSAEAVEAKFAQLDRNGDGLISAGELAKALPALLGGLELSVAEQRVLFAKFDSNGAGKINLDKFAKLIELSEEDIDQLIVRITGEFQAQARLGSSLEALFQRSDTNEDGRLSRREFRRCLEQLLPQGGPVALSNHEMRLLMDRFDCGKSGKVDYRAFIDLCAPSEIEMLAVEARLRDKILAVVKSSKNSSGNKLLKRAFKLFDTDNNGKITRREFQQTCERLALALSEDELELLLQRFDTNGSGDVDYFEFIRFLEHHGGEMEALATRAGQFLDRMQRDGLDPVAAIQVYEGRKQPLGVVPKDEFHRACKNLHLPFTDAEIKALADLYSDNSHTMHVRYRDFVISSLAAIGAPYRGSKRGTVSDLRSPILGGQDQVWNADNLSQWLDQEATPTQREKFERLQKSMKHVAGNRNTQERSLRGVPPAPSSSLSHHRDDSQASALALQQRPTKPWSCPVCFYRQKKASLSCEMCDSPCPTASNTGNSWPHIKPMLDSVYNNVASSAGTYSMASDLPLSPKGEPDLLHLSSPLGDNSNIRAQVGQSTSREPKWLFAVPVAKLQENRSCSKTMKRRSKRKCSSSKHR